MKRICLTLLICAGAVVFSAPLVAGEKGKGKSPKAVSQESNQPKTSGKSAVPTERSEDAKSKEPWVNVKVEISTNEREIIRGYVHSYDRRKGRGPKAKSLPPGLAKQVARGRELPPGWQKKCVRGEIMPLEVFEHCHPLPHDVLVKLPSPPHGTILVAIGGKVVRLAKATREILDVFEVL